MITSPIRICVADEHLIMRRGVATLLLAFNDMVLAGEAQTGAEALARCAECHPDVLLLDLFLPDMDSVALIHSIRADYPSVQVVVLVGLPLHELVQRVVAAGAAGYLLTTASGPGLAATIRGAHAGRPMAAPESFEDMAPTRHVPDRLPKPGADLTCREQEVLALMTHGLTNIQIGAQLIISRATVKFHVSSILSKYGAVSRTEAVAMAVQHQLDTGTGDPLAM